MRKTSFLDEDNTFTRGVKRGAGWATFVKTSPRVKWGLRIGLFALLAFLILRRLGVL